MAPQILLIWHATLQEGSSLQREGHSPWCQGLGPGFSNNTTTGQITRSSLNLCSQWGHLDFSLCLLLLEGLQKKVYADGCNVGPLF
jgi:hypothetical protein